MTAWELITAPQFQADALCARPTCGDAAAFHAPDPETRERIGPCLHGRMDAEQEARCACPGFIAPTPAPEVRTLEGARTALRDYLRLGDEPREDAFFLIAAQTRLKLILPNKCVVDAGFTGPKSSGKSVALRALAQLSRGQYVGSGTVAALRGLAWMNPALFIDEIDEMPAEAQAEAEAMIRAADAWDACHYLREPAPAGDKEAKGGYRTVAMPIGGPKGFAYRGTVQDATASRAVIFEMPPHDDTGLILKNLDDGDRLDRVARFIDRACEAGLKRWTKERVRRHLSEPGFVARVDALPAAISRSRSMGATLLLIADILGWDLEASITATIAAAKDEERGEVERLRAILNEEYERAPSAATKDGIRRKDVLQRVNEDLKAANLRPFTDPAFTRALRECGFIGEKSVVKRRDDHGNRYLVFDAAVRRRLGIDPPLQRKSAGDAESVEKPSDLPAQALTPGETATEAFPGDLGGPVLPEGAARRVKWTLSGDRDGRPERWTPDQLAADCLSFFRLDEAAYRVPLLRLIKSEGV